MVDVRAVQEGVTAIFVLGRLVHWVSDKTEAGRAHQDDLENPVTDMGDGEGFVVAGLVATWLQRVTDKHNLFVLIHLLSHYTHNQDPEYHHHCQQDPLGERKEVTERGKEEKGNGRNRIEERKEEKWKDKKGLVFIFFILKKTDK